MNRVATFRKSALHRAIGEKRRDVVKITFVLKAGPDYITVVVSSKRKDVVTVEHLGHTYTVKTTQQPNVLHWTYPWFLNMAANVPADIATFNKARGACSFNLIRFAENVANAVLEKAGAA